MSETKVQRLIRVLCESDGDEEYEAADIIRKAHAAGFVTDDGEVRAVIGTLPVTADGYVVAHGTELWTIEAGQVYRGRDDCWCYAWFDTIPPTPDSSYRRPYNLCYSTRAAAEAAKGGGQ